METIILNNNLIFELSDEQMLEISAGGFGTALIGAGGGALTGAEVGGLCGHPIIGGVVGAGIGFWFGW